MKSKLWVNGLFGIAFVALIMWYGPWDVGSQPGDEGSRQSEERLDAPPSLDLMFTVDKSIDVGPDPDENRNVELSLDEWYDIKRAAEQRNESVSEYVRSRLFPDLPDPKIETPMDAS